jgi:dihydrofolate reductase
VKSSDTPELVCLHEFAVWVTLQASYQHNRSALPRNVPTNCGSRDWDNSVIVRGDVEAEAAKLKQQDGGPLLVFGHGLFARALLKARLLDVLDLSVHPFIAGSGGLLFQQDQAAAMKLTATKSFSNIVKLTYEPQYDQS